MACWVQVNDNQIRLRGLTRRLMATVTQLVVEELPLWLVGCR